MNTFTVEKCSPTARLPEKSNPDDAGFDLFASEKVIVPAEGKALIKLDIKVAIPKGYYGRIAPRSGLSWKKHTDVGAGVVDSTYRGLVGVVLFNLGKKELIVNVGDRVAQMIITPCPVFKVVEGSVLLDTKRGEGGFGSTGV